MCGTNECLYSAEATGRRIGGQGLPSPPSNPTPPHSSVGFRGGETPLPSSSPLPPSIPPLCSTSFSSWRNPHPPLLPPLASQKEGWRKVSGKRRKRRGGLERAAAGRAPTRGGETGLAVTFMTCVSVRDVRTRKLITCRLKQRYEHIRSDRTSFLLAEA